MLVDKEANIKLADFGLAKIIGEESFTTTLCGTPSYVAPEILADGKHRKYTKAVDVWSLGVVLYICLCGFPPFSDELYSREFPFTLSQQIKSGRFEYPSPYWDSVGDPARKFFFTLLPGLLATTLTSYLKVDLIDSMLVVDPEKRFTIDQCLKHPWTVANMPNPNDSTNGLVSGLAGLEVNRRGIARERTLLSSINTVQVANRVPMGDNQPDIKIYSKNPQGNKMPGAKREAGPADQRDAREFIGMGGKGDQPLFGDDPDSHYSKNDIGVAAPKVKGKAKGKAKGR